MTSGGVCRRYVAAAALLLARPCLAQPTRPAVAAGDGWRGFWRPEATAPARWPAPDSALQRGLTWRAARAGIRWAELPLRGDGEAWRTRVIIVRLDPQQVRFRLDTAFTIHRDRNGAAMRGARWQLSQAPRRSILAVNAGQFEATLLGSLPWGWVVLDGREWQPPGAGPLSTGVVFDSGGGVRFLAPSALAEAWRGGGVHYAFQSFPTLLEGDGEVPAMLRTPGSGVNLTHRDARLAIGVARDGTVILALTRFDVLGRVLGAVPFGLTTPEMAALMGALGCQRAVMLDGGISAQMQLTDARGATQAWPGWRRVPMGLVVQPR